MQEGEEIELRDVRDEVLLASSLHDPELFVYIVRRYEGAFKRKVSAVIRVREDVEDVVQETFVKIYKNAHRFKEVEGASFKSWAYTILMNTACTRYRRKTVELGRRADIAVEHYESLPDSVHEGSFGMEMGDYIKSIFIRMPTQLRRVLEMHFIEHLPQALIAQREGVSVGAIKTRVHRAKAEFKKIAGNIPLL